MKCLGVSICSSACLQKKNVHWKKKWSQDGSTLEPFWKMASLFKVIFSLISGTKTVPKWGPSCWHENGYTLEPFRLHFFLSVSDVSYFLPESFFAGKVSLINTIKMSNSVDHVSRSFVSWESVLWFIVIPNWLSLIEFVSDSWLLVH